MLDEQDREWTELRRRWTRIDRDERGNIVAMETAVIMCPAGFPEAAVERTVPEGVAPGQAAQIETALAWQPTKGLDVLVQRLPLDEGLDPVMLKTR